MVKLILIILLILTVASIGMYINHHQSEIVRPEPKATLQYVKPIGPTQTEPYQLQSSLIGGTD